jgi:hypothetical protein
MLLLRVRARATQFSQRKMRLSVSTLEDRVLLFYWSASYGQESSLSPDPLLLCLGDVAIMAIFDAAKPANTRFRANILSAIQPAAVYGAFHGVYARLVDGVRVAGHPKEHVISSGGVEANTAPHGTAMV